MGFYRKKPVVIEAITFQELVEHGKIMGGNIVNGMPWSFEYKGHSITHENDELYLIPTLEGIHNFTPQDVLITGVNGEIYPCKIEIFEKTYESVEGCTDNKMTGGQALDAMNKGAKVRVPEWKGYWFKKNGQLWVYTEDGQEFPQVDMTWVNAVIWRNDFQEV